jgi:hypothetical protein
VSRPLPGLVPPILFLAGGGAIIAAALLWWGLSYWEVYHNDYLSMLEASRCLVADSTICRLAASLCGARHIALVAVYSPVTLWIGMATACWGLVSAASL